MKMWKMLAAVGVMACLMLVGCGNGGQTDSKHVKELKIAISPYQDADTMKTATEPLGKMIQDKMKEKG